jgi:hypothetical protein
LICLLTFLHNFLILYIFLRSIIALACNDGHVYFYEGVSQKDLNCIGVVKNLTNIPISLTCIPAPDLLRGMSHSQFAPRGSSVRGVSVSEQASLNWIFSSLLSAYKDALPEDIMSSIIDPKTLTGDRVAVDIPLYIRLKLPEFSLLAIGEFDGTVEVVVLTKDVMREITDLALVRKDMELKTMLGGSSSRSADLQGKDVLQGGGAGLRKDLLFGRVRFFVVCFCIVCDVISKGEGR